MPNPSKAVPSELTDALAKINTATTNLANVVKQLRDTISTSMTQADVDNVKGTLDQIGTSLDAIAADPNTPVPPTPAPQFHKKP